MHLAICLLWLAIAAARAVAALPPAFTTSFSGIGEALPAVASRDTVATELSYVVQAGDNLARIAARHRSLTGHYSLNEVIDAIRQRNGLSSDLLQPGQQLRVPIAEKRRVPVVATPVDSGGGLRAIYLSGPRCATPAVFATIDSFVVAGGNAVVFDAKDIDGAVTLVSAHPLASWGIGRRHPTISRPADFLQRLADRRLYVVARIAVFLDSALGSRRPDLALRDSTEAVWTERDCVWLDPRLPAVTEYNVALAAELARAGVDEIQFDYVRFPTNGWHLAAGADDADGVAARCRAIGRFLAAAREVLAPLGACISADLYGVVGWGRDVDVAVTGQQVAMVAEHVDVICPMIYPSHFGPGFAGCDDPAADPAGFVTAAVERFVQLAAGRALIRPWLQAFDYRVGDFDAAYVAVQITAALAAGGDGWSLWNPASRYNVAIDGLRLHGSANPAVNSSVDVVRADRAAGIPSSPKKDDVTYEKLTKDTAIGSDQKDRSIVVDWRQPGITESARR